MRKLPFLVAAISSLIFLIVGLRTFNVEAGITQQADPSDVTIGVFTAPPLDRTILENGAPQEDADSYLANPLPPVPDDGGGAQFGANAAAAQAPSAELDGCYEYMANPSFESNGDWYGQPASNIGFTDQSWVSGVRSAFLNTNFYSNAALWQTIRVPQDVNSAGLSFYTGAVFADPGETVYITIYDESFTELIFWSYLTYTQIGSWKHLADSLPVQLLAGRTIQLTFQMAQDYDGFYSEIVIDDVSLVLCSDGAVGAPTATPTPTPTSTAQPATPKPAATATATLLPANTPIATTVPVTPDPGSAVDLAIAGIQVGQTLMTGADPVTGAAVPLIAGKPALARVYVDVSGANAVDNLDATLFLRDAQNQVRTVKSLNGPIQLIGDSTEGSPGSTVNFLLDIAWLSGQVDFWAEIDPANLIAENNESNNVSAEIARTFQAGPKLRIAWMAMNPGVNTEIAATSDSDLRKFFPAGVDDIEYFFQPGFNESINTPLTVQSYPEYLNALNRFWDRMTHEGKWVGGTPPDRLYGWAGGQPSGLCGVADAIFAGGRGRVAVGYAEGCGAETLAHELGHTFDRTGLRHSPNRSSGEDPNCISPPGGPEPQYPLYPNLPLGSIGVVGFDAARLQLLFPDRTYDFMSYCAPEWISPFNYARMVSGFAPATSLNAAEGQEFSAKLLVSGMVTRETFAAEMDPFYVIRSDVAAEPSRGTEFCVELRDEGNTTLESRCFDLGFINIETGQPIDADGFSMVVPYPQATTKVVLTRNGSELASRMVSRNQPFVRLTSPTGGADLSGDQVTVTWNGADLDDDKLYYSLAYSIDGGASWLPLATDLTASSVVVDLNTLPGSNQVQFRVGASDGINTTYATSDSLEIGSVANNGITVSGKPPTAVIRTEATHIDAGSAVALEGTGYDLEDGLLPEGELRWWSNRDGDLGAGSWLRPTLSTGRHTISLTVTDSDGNTDVATKSLQVGADNGAIYLPMVAGK